MAVTVVQALLVSSQSTLHYSCESWTLLADAEKRIQAFETKCLRKLLCISYLEHETNNWVQSKINFLVGPQEPLLQLSRDENLLGSGMSQATTAFPKPSFREHCGVGNAVVSRGNIGRTTSKSGHLYPCQNCSQGPLAERIGSRSPLNHPRVPSKT